MFGLWNARRSGNGRVPAGHGQAVERWARSTWEAYSPLHAIASRWIQQALSGTAASTDATRGRR